MANLLDKEHQNFNLPPWLKEVIFIAGFVVSLTLFGANLKSDLRSNREAFDDFRSDTREQIKGLQSDIADIKASIPNKDLYERRFQEIDSRIDLVNSTIGDVKLQQETLQMLHQRTREGLIRRGIIE